MTKRKPAMVFHPGEFIQEELDARNQDASVLRCKNWDGLQVDGMLRGELPVDNWLALHLHRLWDTSPELWLNLQESWDSWPDRQSPPPIKEKAERS